MLKQQTFEIMDKEQDVTREVSVKDGGNKQTLIKQENLNTGFGVLNIFDEKQVVAAEAFLKRMMSTDKGGIKNVNEGFAMILRAQELHLPFTSCVEHVHVISGKTGIDIHIIRSLLSRAGVTWECTKDYAPQYQYTDGNTIYLETQLPDYCVKCRTAKEAEEKTTDDVVGVYPVKWYTDLKGNIYNEFQVSAKCVTAINKVHAAKLAQEGQYPVIRIAAQPIDWVTEYEFTRYKMINGTERVTKCKSHFSYSEAVTAQLIGVGKDNWDKYPRIMTGIRAFTYGARDIADDALMGCYETSELEVITGTKIKDYDFDDATIIE